MKTETVEARAVKIAAKIMQADGLCRYDDVDKCRRVYATKETCERCIHSWLLTKAKVELIREGKMKHECRKSAGNSRPGTSGELRRYGGCK